ncbi:FecR domain-containing protein, partial [Thermodesulfobacteriota bacterium]
LALGPMSRLSVSQYLYSSEDKRSESIYELLDGKLRAVVGSTEFSIKTPTAFAAARGTIFIIWYDAATNTTGLAVLEGSVVIKNIDGSVAGEQTLTAGQMTTVTGKNPPAFPENFKIINMAGPAIGNDIGPIFYQVEIEGIPEIAFIDNWRGEGGKLDVLDWDDKGLPDFLLEGDVYGKDPLMDGAEYGGE